MTKLAMNAFSVACALLASQLSQAQAPLPPEIENPACLGINKEAPHAILMPYANLQQALEAKRTGSTFYKSLNGKWKFNWVPRPEGRPTTFFEPGFDVSGWKDIPVPSCWQMHGYGTPVYANAFYWFKKDWPHVMGEPPKDWVSYNERNAVGSYRRTFEVPSAWKGRNVNVTFNGVDAAFYVWVNGKFVGYSINSRIPAEFNLTKFIKPGANTMAVQVYRLASSTYIENQDMWSLSGIYRDVYLWSTPKVHVRDFWANPDLDAKYRDATMTVKAKVRNYDTAKSLGKTLFATVYDKNGKVVGKGVSGVTDLKPGEEANIDVSLNVKNPAKWSAEIPNLYTTVLTLKSAKGVEEILSCKTGFRKVEIKGRVFCINGVPVKLKGTNRHENWGDTGHTETVERKLIDIGLLKRANMNHVRTSHYSNDPSWYELCDEHGIYLNAEANVECHGYYNVLDREPAYRPMIVASNVANVELYKNHPSVIIWSLGNENGGGSNLKAACDAVHALDKTRPVHYEAFGYDGDAPADFESQMYTSPAGTEAWGKRNAKVPFYLCEYAHAMNNSMGAIGEYNDIFDKYEGLMGGAIWEWQDQALMNDRVPGLKPFLVYGGGFGEQPTSGRFILKGVVDAFHKENSKYWEAKRAYQWIGFQLQDPANGTILIKNKYAFLTLDGFDFSWELTENGTRVQGGKLPKLECLPGGYVIVKLPIQWGNVRHDKEYAIRLSASLSGSEPWAKAGYEMAAAQFVLPLPRETQVPPNGFSAIQVTDSRSFIQLKGFEFAVTFDKMTGTIVNLAYEGKQVLGSNGGPRLNAWRAPHHNDDFWASNGWEALGLDALKTGIKNLHVKEVAKGVVQVSYDTVSQGADDFRFTRQTVYTVFGDGRIAVDESVEASEPTAILPRLGVRMALGKELDGLTWYGRGPHENYPDRKRGADLGVWTSKVSEQVLPYVQPMEYGNHEDTRWTALTRKDGSGVLFAAESGPFSMSALPHSDEELGKANFAHELPASSQTTLCLSWRTLGVGSAACGPKPLDKYIIHAEPLSFSWSIRPVRSGQDLGQVGSEPLPARVAPALVSFGSDGKLVLSSATPGAMIGWAPTGTILQLYTGPVVVNAREFEVAVSKAGLLSPPVRVYSLAEAPVGFLSHEGWKIASVSSFEQGEGNPEHAIDGNPSTFWHTRYTPSEVPYPHFIDIDLGRTVRIQSVVYKQRTDMDNGRIKGYELYVSADGKDWGQPVVKGSFKNRNGRQFITPTQPVSARFIRLRALSSHNGQAFAAVAELDVVEAK